MTLLVIVSTDSDLMPTAAMLAQGPWYIAFAYDAREASDQIRFRPGWVAGVVLVSCDENWLADVVYELRVALGGVPIAVIREEGDLALYGTRRVHTRSEGNETFSEALPSEQAFGIGSEAGPTA
jgi:hypothetical protein